MTQDGAGAAVHVGQQSGPLLSSRLRLFSDGLGNLHQCIGQHLIGTLHQNDLEEIDQTVRAALQFILVEQAEQVLENALVRDVTAVQTAEKPGQPVLDETQALPAHETQTAPVLRQ